jgi:glycosyltransferase involved in cell wall biosynthesis
MPKISFVCTTYNHEKFVGDAIESILKQSEPDFELIIVDNCSTDNNIREIKKFSDKRIKLIEHKYNQGIAASFVDGCLETNSNIVCGISSDDIFAPNYVEKILQSFNDGDYDAVYISMEYMDENGEKFEGWIQHQPKSLSSEEIFARLFCEKNLLTFIGLAIKKSFLFSFLPKHFGMIQYLDYQMHLTIFFRGKVLLLEDVLVCFRYRSNHANAGSIIRPDCLLRGSIETKEFMDTAVNLIGEDIETFKRFFGSHPLIASTSIYPQTIRYWLARIALTSKTYEKQIWGLATVYDFISKRENLDLLNKYYGFTYADYMSFADLIIPPISEQTKKLMGKVKKYKNMSKNLGAALLAAIIIFILTKLI